MLAKVTCYTEVHPQLNSMISLLSCTCTLLYYYVVFVFHSYIIMQPHPNTPPPHTHTHAHSQIFQCCMHLIHPVTLKPRDKTTSFGSNSITDHWFHDILVPPEHLHRLLHPPQQLPRPWHYTSYGWSILWQWGRTLSFRTNIFVDCYILYFKWLRYTNVYTLCFSYVFCISSSSSEYLLNAVSMHLCSASLSAARGETASNRVMMSSALLELWISANTACKDKITFALNFWLGRFSNMFIIMCVLFFPQAHSQILNSFKITSYAVRIALIMRFYQWHEFKIYHQKLKNDDTHTH